MAGILSAGSRCLAYHGPLLYEAKTLRVWDPKTKTAKSKAPQSEGSGEKEANSKDLPEELQNEVAYFVHYKGWKQTWDEWVGQDRVLAWNEENIRRQKELKQNALATMARSKSKTIATTGPSGADIVLAGNVHNPSENTTSSGRKRKESTKEDEPAKGGRGQKRRAGANGVVGGPAEIDAEREEDYLKRPEIEMEMPSILKAQLVDDWEKVTKNRKLVKLPAKLSVDEILLKYRKAVAPQRKTNTVEAGIFDEVISGLKVYFEKALGNILLYRFERQQYLEIKKKHPNKNMTQLYGAEHLLRLLASLPGLIAQTHMDEQGITHLKEHIEQFLRFLMEKRTEIFLNEYEETSQRYEALSKGI